MRNRIIISTIILLVAVPATGFSQRPAGRLAQRLKELDKNGDRQLSREEFGRSDELFQKVDSDGNDQITLLEVQSFLRGGGTFRDDGIPDAKPFEAFGEFSDALPLSLASCRAAADYSKSANGHAVLVMHDGKIVYERYDNGWARDQAHRLASGTKSFSGVAAALAVQDGLFEFDDAVSETITEWRSDPRLSKVTIRQLLSLTSGIDPGENSVVLPYAQAIKAEAKQRPGTKFAYGPNPFQVFGELMQRKLPDDHQTMLDYLQARVFEPIGMKVGQWRRTVNGDPHVPSGAFIAAREWVKFGELLRLNGKWQETQIVREDLLSQLTVGSRVNPAYGITFWLSAKKGLGAGEDSAGRSTTPSIANTDLSDLFMAAGAGKQRLYVIRPLKLVVVRFGETQGRKFRDDEFLARLLVKNK